MRGLIFCVFAIMVLTPAQGSGENEEQPEQQWEKVGFEAEKESMKCFRCDLGFWDVCYTTETNCSLGEVCFTGRGKAGLMSDSLDIKTLGCVRAEECGVETTVELFMDKTIFVMTRHCCGTSFCNSAQELQISTFFYLTVAALATWHLTETPAASC